MNFSYIISKVKFISLWHFWKYFLIQLLYLVFHPTQDIKIHVIHFTCLKLKGIIGLNVIIKLKYELS
jgi:hypothetical protein